MLLTTQLDSGTLPWPQHLFPEKRGTHLPATSSKKELELFGVDEVGLLSRHGFLRWEESGYDNKRWTLAP